MPLNKYAREKSILKTGPESIYSTHQRKAESIFENGLRETRSLQLICFTLNQRSLQGTYADLGGYIIRFLKKIFHSFKSVEMNDAFIAEDSLIVGENRDQNPDENQLNGRFPDLENIREIYNQ